MCIQYIPFEGFGVSNIKVALILLSPFIWMYSGKLTAKTVFFGVIYIFSIVFSLIYNTDSFRFDTVAYKIGFIIIFLLYYELIHHNKVLSPESFIKFLVVLISTLTIFLLLQQLAIIIGLSSLKILNFYNYLNRGLGSNSLFLEPSHFARILTVLMLVLLRMKKIEWGKNNFKISRFFKVYKWICLGFLWCMITMGSATAFIGLLILLLYFLDRKHAFFMIVFIPVLYFTIPLINYEPLTRAINAFEASLSFDAQKIIETDYSAASRLVPLINTIYYTDFTDVTTWLGKGVDVNASADYLSEEQKIGGITDYGLISFIFSLIFVFRCSINKIWSPETIIFFILMGGTIGNIAYVWGILMLFTTIKYFENNKILYKQNVFI